MGDFVVILLPLLGVVIGASLQFVLGRAAQRRSDLERERVTAYVDYLRAVAAAAHLRSDEDLRDADRDAADAKSRIAVYGSASVVAALAQFERGGRVLSSDKSIATFVDLIEAMRPGKVNRADIALLLVGERRSPDHR